MKECYKKVNELRQLYQNLKEAVDKSDVDAVEVYLDEIGEFVSNNSLSKETKEWIVKQDEEILPMMKERMGMIRNFLINRNKQQMIAQKYEEL